MMMLRKSFLPLGAAALLMLFLASAGYGQSTGAGGLTVNNNTDICPGATGFVHHTGVQPNWDVLQDAEIHINIEADPSLKICTAGANINSFCTSASDCETGISCTGTPGSKTCTGGTKAGDHCTNVGDCATCSTSLECSGDTNVFIAGDDANPCTGATQATDCVAAGETGVCDTGVGLCQFVDTIPTTVGSTAAGQIDVCYTTRTDACSEAKVGYCGANYAGSFLANDNLPANAKTFGPAVLRIVDSEDEPLNTSALCKTTPASCTNAVGSFCCGLTQGAYGAPNSTATAAGSGDCPGTGLGFIEAAACAGDYVFGSAGGTCPNSTTIGQAGKSVTIDSLTTLIAYLAASGTPGKFKGISGDNCWSSPTSIPDRTSSGSRGEGGGTLSGESMSCGINIFLSNAEIGPTGGTGGIDPSGFGSFNVGDLPICTKTSGEDKVLGTGDDLCRAFFYPSCVFGKTVSEIKAAADAELATGSNTLGCTASQLNVALDNINNEFDQCGNVIACPESVTPPASGTGIVSFACPAD